MEGTLPLTGLLGALAVEHRHRLPRLVIGHGGGGGGRARARGGRRRRIRTLDIVRHVRSAFEARSPRLQALVPPPRPRCWLGHLFFRSGRRRLQRQRGDTSARRRQHRGLLAVIEGLERLHAGHDGERPKRRRGPLVHDEDEDRHDHAASDRERWENRALLLRLRDSALRKDARVHDDTKLGGRPFTANVCNSKAKTPDRRTYGVSWNDFVT